MEDTHRILTPVVLALFVVEVVFVGVYVTGRLAGVNHSAITFWFNINQESNIPSWFSGQLLFSVGLCWGGVAWLNWSRLGRPVGYALAMMAIFLFFSFDEMVGIHERIGAMLDGESRKGTAFHWTGRWALILVPIAALGLTAVLWRVRAAHGNAIVKPILAGAAVFLVMAGFGDLLENVWDGEVSHVWQVAIEELGEMMGVTLILGASLRAVLDSVYQPAPADAAVVVR